MALPGLSAGQKKRLQIHPAGLLIILLSFGAWVVALGGVGSATSNCASGLKANNPNASANVNCAKVYQWQWWGLWFEGCMLVSIFVAVFFESFNKGKQVVQSYLIMCTVILMQSSNYFITNSQLGTGNFSIKSKLQVANNAGAAGYTILAVFNFALLIILGYTPGPANPPPVRLDEIPMGAV